MAKTLEQILGHVALGKVITAVKDGVPDVLPPGFRGTRQQYLGKSVRYFQMKHTRKTARRVQYGSPALRRPLVDAQERDAVLIHSFEEKHLDPLTLQRLRAFEDYTLQRMGMQEVARQVEEQQRIFTNLEIAAVMHALFDAAIYFDASGNLLPSSASAQESVTYGISASHQNQLGGIIAASWNTVTTDIPLHIRQIKKQARRDTGYELKYAFYGENIVTYLQKNDFVKDWFTRNPQKNQEFLDSGDLPRGFLGIQQWIPAYQYFFEDDGGTNQTVVGVDDLTFTPEPSLDWWEMAEGSFQVPSNFNAAASAMEAINSLATVFGQFGYAVPSHNPPSVVMYQGHTFLPLLKVPDAIFQADVTP